MHDVCLSIENMTPGEYKNGGEALRISYDMYKCVFGDIFIASTQKGICHVAFTSIMDEGLEYLQHRFPRATFTQGSLPIHTQVLASFVQNNQKIPLHITGTAFQLKVWEALLKIPTGKLTTYGHIAKAIEHPKAYRAVGSAVGDNPVAYLIPCHRVIQSSGALGNYHWGSEKKSAMIGWEMAKVKT